MEFNRCMGCMEEIAPDIEVCPHCGYKKGTPAKEIFHLEPETILAGRYVIGKSLGSGGFGITYIAWDIEMERKVAIKEYLPHDFATRFQGQTVVSVYGGEATEQFDAGLHSFVEEAKVLAKFHFADGIVHIYDSFIENSTAYIIMEYIDGESLKAKAIKKGKIPYDEAVSYIIPVLRGLEKVHAEGIIHRDIAPDNIMLTEDKKVRLIDFGAAKYATTFHSKSMSVVLKPGYSPEEQYRSRGNQGPWTDIYAISATLYRLITGVVPIDAQERKNSENVLKKPSELGIDIPENIEIAIMNGMNIYAENRYQSAKEFADVLENLVPAEVIPEEIDKDNNGGLSKKVKIGMLAGIGVAVAILIALLSTGTLKKIAADRLPNVIEMSVEQAAETLEPYGYVYSTDETEAENKIRIEDTVYDLAIPENMILSQSPNAGSKVDTDKYPDVYLVLSAGARDVYLPITSFVGMEKSEAVSQIEALGLVVNLAEASSDEYAAGYVCAQEYEPETKLKEGDSITITVSTGSEDNTKETVKVPDVVGKTQEKAQQILSDTKLFTAIEEEYSNTVPAGCVISQNPSAGSDAVTNETIVTIVISKGAKADETTRVPDVANRKQSNAVNLLKSANLNYKVEYAYSNNIAQGTVISQSIKADTKVKVGTTVTITVSKGAKNDSTAQKEQATEKTTNTIKVGVSFNANGGKVSPTSMSATYNSSYGSLPTPTRDYYTFEGWYTSATGGSKITASSKVSNSANHTLYAHWTQNSVSGWVLESNVPSGAQVVNEKWIYTKTETTESTSSSLSGWSQIGSYWKQTNSGTHYYASFPSGFNKGDGRYSKYNGSAISSYENTSNKRTVSGSSIYTYVYYHWAYDNPSFATENNCYVTDTYNTNVGNGYKGTIWECFESTTNATEYKQGCYKFTGHSSHSWWWFKVPVYKQTYTDYQKVYQYKKVTTGLESSTKVTAGGQISDVKKYVQYRAK